MEQDFKIRLLDWFTHALKIIGATIVGFLFVAMLMVATAQQQIVAGLASQSIQGGYSGGLVLYQSALEKESGYDQLKRDFATWTQKQQQSYDSYLKTEAKLAAAWEPIQEDYSQVAALGTCGSFQPPSQTDDAAQYAIAKQIANCNPGPSEAAKADALRPAQKNAAIYLHIARDDAAAGDQVTLATTKVQQIRPQVNAGPGLTKEEESVWDMFNQVESAGLILGPLVSLASLTPPLLQLLLTFVAGMFGALLVTLVLIVYPGNAIMSVADARPVTRTFLGGLIALCVYIVLLGGTAVLGSASSEHAAGDNYMAFAGIGILAGMFSDRVAGWLSKRADEFFKQ